jgi:hypothetical protein
MRQSSRDGSAREELRAEGRKLPIVSRTVVGPELAIDRSLHAFCPMVERTVALETCVECAFCAGFDATQEWNSTVSCTFEGACLPPNSVGAAWSRSALCVRANAVKELGGIIPRVGTVPVVDAQVRLVAVLDAATGALRSSGDGGSAEHTIPESWPIAEALAALARRKARQAIVLAGDRTVVGIVEELGLMRALKGRSARPGE